MEAALAPTIDTPPASPARDNTRRCLVLGEMLPKDELIRFVIGPDDSVVPDLAHNLPGRGLWVTADRPSIAIAGKKNLFAKSAKTTAKPDPNLADIVAALLHKRCLDFLGLARRSGIAVLGQPQVEAAVKAGKLDMLLLADDAGSTIDTPQLTPSRRFSRHELGAALGHEQLVYVGLRPHSLTQKLQAELARLDKIATQPHTCHTYKESEQQEK